MVEVFGNYYLLVIFSLPLLYFTFTLFKQSCDLLLVVGLLANSCSPTC